MEMLSVGLNRFVKMCVCVSGRCVSISLPHSHNNVSHNRVKKQSGRTRGKCSEKVRDRNNVVSGRDTERGKNKRKGRIFHKNVVSRGLHFFRGGITNNRLALLNKTQYVLNHFLRQWCSEKYLKQRGPRNARLITMYAHECLK